MKPLFALLAALALSSCAQIPGTPMDAGLAMSRMPSTCYARAPITGQVNVATETGKGVGEAGWNGYSVKKVEDDGESTLICSCNENYNMALFTKRDAENSFKSISEKSGWKVIRSEFFDMKEKKFFNVHGEASNYRGEFVARGTFIFEGKCMQGAIAWVRRGQEATANAFLASAYDARTSRPLFAPPVLMAPAPAAAPIPPPPLPSTSSATPSVESRLATLKDLLDRKVITQQEHDERRRAVLGSL